MKDWQDVAGGNANAPLTALESTHRVCQVSNKPKLKVFMLPKLNFAQSQSLCGKIKGSLFYEDKIFVELMLMEQQRSGKGLFIWIPYTDVAEEGTWRNVYTNLTFVDMEKYLEPGQPNGGTTDNCMSWDSEGGLWDDTCSNKVYLQNSEQSYNAYVT